MKIGPKVALDDTIADTKFQGSGYTGSSGKADTRIVLDQFFQSSQCSKSYHNIFTHKSEHFEAKTRLYLQSVYLMPRNCGFSPGAAVSDSLVSDLTWLMDKTVAATNQGSPKTEHTPIKTATMKRSRW